MVNEEQLVPLSELRRKCDENCAVRVEAAIKISEVFRVFFESLAYHELPAFLNRLLPQETAFYIVAEMMARAAERAFPILMNIMESLEGRRMNLSGKDVLDRLLIHDECHSRMAKILGHPVVVFKTAREGDRVVFYTESCPFKKEKKNNPLICAVCLGVILGATRYLASTRPVYLIRSKKELSDVPSGSIVIYQTRRTKGCRIEVFVK